MSKTQEALKLALETLKGGLWDYGPGQDEHQRCNEVIAICESALADHTEQHLEVVAEQSAPISHITDEQKIANGLAWLARIEAMRKECAALAEESSGTEQPAQQQEPVAGVVIREGLPTLLQDRHIKPTDQRLYTSPPASKPWVELTADEMVWLVKKYRGAPMALLAAAETKLREKNA